MPDFSLKEPNLTAEISWSLRIKDSIEGDGVGDDIVVVLRFVFGVLRRLFMVSLGFYRGCTWVE